MPNCKLTNKAHSHTSFLYFALIFSEYITITSSEEALKMCEHNFFREIKGKEVLLVIYLFNYDSSEPIYSYMAFDVLLSIAFVK